MAWSAWSDSISLLLTRIPQTHSSSPALNRSCLQTRRRRCPSQCCVTRADLRLSETKRNHSQMRREHSISSLHLQQQRSAVRGCLGVTQFLKPHPSAQTMRQQNSSLQSATPPVRVHSQSQSCQNPQRSRRRSPHSSARDTPSRVTHCSFPLS